MQHSDKKAEAARRREATERGRQYAAAMEHETDPDIAEEAGLPLADDTWAAAHVESASARVGESVPGSSAGTARLTVTVHRHDSFFAGALAGCAVGLVLAVLFWLVSRGEQ